MPNRNRSCSFTCRCLRSRARIIVGLSSGSISSSTTICSTTRYATPGKSFSSKSSRTTPTETQWIISPTFPCPFHQLNIWARKFWYNLKTNIRILKIKRVQLDPVVGQISQEMFIDFAFYERTSVPVSHLQVQIYCLHKNKLWAAIA